MPRRPAALLLLAGLATLHFVPGAEAHGPFDQRVRVEVGGLEPASPDVRVVASFDVQGLPPRMTARNDGAADLMILDSTRKPLFRVGRAGSFGNVRSVWYRPSVDPFHVLPAPVPKPGTAPDWRKLADEPVWRWYEDRANFHARVPPSIAATDGPVELATWRIPVRLGARDAAITGRVVWKVPKGSIRARVLAPGWAPKGLTVDALQGPVPGLQVRNSTALLLEITGRDGQPFARVWSSGVEVNTRSITWADSKGIPEQPGEGPAWRHETDLPVLIWVENRAAYERPDVPGSVERAGGEQVLSRWEVPAILGGKRVTIQGETYWRPLLAGTQRSSIPYVAVGGLVAVAALAGWLLRRSRSSASG